MADRYWVGDGGNWSDNTNHWSASSGGAAGASKPTSSDDVIFDASSFSLASQTVTVDENANVRSFTATSVDNNPTVSFASNSITMICSIDFTLPATGITFGVNVTGKLRILSGTTSTGGNLMSIDTLQISVSGGSATITLGSDLSVAGTIVHAGSTFDANDYNVTMASWSQSGVGTPAALLMGSGQWRVEATTAHSGGWTSGGSYSINAETSSLFIKLKTGTSQSFSANTITFYDVEIQGDDNGSGTLLFGASNMQFNNFGIVHNDQDMTVQWRAGATYTFASFEAHGTEDHPITFTTSSGGSTTTLSTPLVSVRYIDVRDNIASGLAAPFYDTGGTDNGNNTSWIFGNGTLPTYSTSLISAVSASQQENAQKAYLIAGRSQSAYRVFKNSTTHTLSVFRTAVYRIGTKFDILSISIPVVLNSSCSIIPKLFFDGESTSQVGTIINRSNYPNAGDFIVLRPPNFSNAVSGDSDFFLELQFIGIDLAVVMLPIEIDVDIKN